MDGVVLGEMSSRTPSEIAAFESKIQLAQERAAELAEDSRGLVETHFGERKFFRQLGQAGEDVQIGHDLVRNA